MMVTRKKFHDMLAGKGQPLPKLNRKIQPKNTLISGHVNSVAIILDGVVYTAYRQTCKPSEYLQLPECLRANDIITVKAVQ